MDTNNAAYHSCVRFSALSTPSRIKALSPHQRFLGRVIWEDTDRARESSAASEKRPKRLIERFREAIRSRHYSRRTEKTYWYWIRYFIFFHGKRNPAEMGGAQAQCRSGDAEPGAGRAPVPLQARARTGSALARGDDAREAAGAPAGGVERRRGAPAARVAARRQVAHG